MHIYASTPRSPARRAVLSIILHAGNFVKLFSSSKCTKIFPKTTSEHLGGGWVVHVAQIAQNLKKTLAICVIMWYYISVRRG